MANALIPFPVKTQRREVVKLYSHVIATGADHPNWLDDSTAADTAQPPATDYGRNEGIYGWSRQGAGDHIIVLQHPYSYLAGVHIFVGDESATDDQVVGFTLLAEDVDSGTAPSIVTTTANGPQLRFQLYDDAGNAQEVTDGNHIFVEITLYNSLDT